MFILMVFRIEKRQCGRSGGGEKQIIEVFIRAHPSSKKLNLPQIS